ncbi:hypothetical protein [Rhizobium sp. 2MFCol3.1]|uniref:hypothetical protein n=1 Tax=Rhizobium sp. 2MFCol3.1 TaxID=1246459 RepID=UPI00036A2A72|nr:hypothetical protein [Rhizobium sp. 2MFCol3.1]
MTTPICVINLDRWTDRWSDFSEQAAALHLDLVRVPGVDRPAIRELARDGCNVYEDIYKNLAERSKRNEFSLGPKLMVFLEAQSL